MGGAWLALLLICLGGTSALADSEDEPDPSPGITGDWGGLRERLQDQGWTIDIRQKLEAASNATGGVRRSIDGAGETRFGVTADLDKLAGIHGASAHLMLTQRYGAGLGEPSGLDPLMPFTEVHGRGDIARLTQFWLEQKLAGGRMDLKLGRTNPGSDFDALSCHFQNLTFCGSVPGNLVGDYWYNWPVSQWGGRVKVKLGGHVYLQAGAYQANPENLDDGFTFGVSRGRGVLTPAEIGWTPKLGGAGLPGSYLLGGWYANIHSPDVLLDASGRPQPSTGPRPFLQRAGRYGVYASAEQQVTGRPEGRGLSLFAHFTQADARTSTIDRQVSFGLSYRGPWQRRPKDVLALAFGATHVNDRAALSEAMARSLSLPVPIRHTEEVGELDYRIHAAEGVTLTPNAQYVRHADGVTGRDALVLGFKTIIKL